MDVAKKTPVSTASPAGSKEAAETETGGPSSLTKDDDERPRRTPTPDRVKCAICLGDLVNKSYSNTCIHQFCFGCLLEWSKVKPECPLCKSTFRSIYHNIRSINDFDEYIVPAPVPHLSIRVSSGTDRSPELLITSGGNHHDYSLPGYFHRAEALMQDPNHRLRRDAGRFLRFRYQFTPFGLNSSTPDVDVLLRGGMPVYPLQQENPFISQADVPEFFGAALDLAASSSSSAANANSGRGFIGYQGRRRRYDRSQWVRPFDSTLAPGTVFFPSIEYLQRHPSSMRRITDWLHREISVLLSLNSTRAQMAFVYDLIISMLYRYDIRSSEFREGLRQHFGNRTRHFQHEFYYFLLSGMRMEEYDRIAQYTPPSATNTSTTTSGRSHRNPMNAEPAVVTIDSDEDQDAIVEIVDILDDDSNDRQTENTTRNSSNRRSGGSSSTRRNRNVPDILPLHNNQLPFPIDLPDSLDAFEHEFDPEVLFSEIGRDFEGLVRNSRESNSRDPEMPVLEPQVDLNNVNNTGEPSSSRGPSAFRRLDERPIHASSEDPPALNRIPENGRQSRVHGLFDNLRQVYSNSRFEDFTEESSRQSQADGEEHRDPVDGRRSPYPTIFSPDISMPINRPLRSPDFPILQLRQNIERRTREGDSTTSDNARPSRHDRSSSFGYPFGNEIPGFGSTVDDNQTYTNSERSSCIHAPHSSSSVQIRLFPPAMDLSTQGRGGRHNSQSPDITARSNSVIQRGPRTPGRPPSPPRSVNSEECEFLGVHPIVKKPPLAVITLSSEDEGDSPNPNPQTPRITKENKPTRSSTSPQAGPSYQQFLPPIKRHQKCNYYNPNHNHYTPSSIANLDAALSSLPSENLIDRHISEISSALGSFEHDPSSLELPLESSNTRSRSKSKSPCKRASRSNTRKKEESKSKRTKQSLPPPTTTSHSRHSSSFCLTEELRKRERRGQTGLYTELMSSSSSDWDDFLGKKELPLPVKKRCTKKSSKTKSSKKTKTSPTAAKSVKKDKGKKEKKATTKESTSTAKESKPRKSSKSSPQSLRELFSMPDRIRNGNAASTSIAASSSQSNFSASPSSSRLRSVVVKVDKSASSSGTNAKSQKPPKKRKVSRLLSSSSESSDDDHKSKKTEDKFPTPKIRSVISNPHACSTQSIPSSSSHSTQALEDTPTPSALDLSAYNGGFSPSPILMNSGSATVSFPKSSRRWESDDDEDVGSNLIDQINNVIGGNDVSGSESLLSLDYGHRADLDAKSRSSTWSEARGVGVGLVNTDSDSDGPCDVQGYKRPKLHLGDSSGSEFSP